MTTPIIFAVSAADGGITATVERANVYSVVTVSDHRERVLDRFYLSDVDGAVKLALAVATDEVD